MASKVRGFILLFLLVIIGNISANGNIKLCLTDNNVRLRNKPTLDSQVIRLMKKNDLVTFITSAESSDGDYKWIHVSTSSGNGWIYGQYLSVINEGSKEILLTDYAGIIVNKNIISIGLTKEKVNEILGTPTSLFHDDEYNEDILYYGKSKELQVIL